MEIQAPPVKIRAASTYLQDSGVQGGTFTWTLIIMSRHSNLSRVHASSSLFWNPKGGSGSFGTPSVPSETGISYLGLEMDVEEVKELRLNTFFSSFCLV